MASFLSRVRSRSTKAEQRDGNYEQAYHRLIEYRMQQKEKEENEAGGDKDYSDSKAKYILKKIRKWRSNPIHRPELEKAVAMLGDVQESYFMPDTDDLIVEPFRDRKRKEIRKEFRDLLMPVSEAQEFGDEPVPDELLAIVLVHFRGYAADFLNYCADFLCKLARHSQTRQVRENVMECIGKAVLDFSKLKGQDISKDFIRPLVDGIDDENEIVRRIAAHSLCVMPLEPIKTYLDRIAQAAFYPRYGGDSESNQKLCIAVCRWVRTFDAGEKACHWSTWKQAKKHVEECLLSTSEGTKQHGLELLEVYPYNSPEINRHLVDCLRPGRSALTRTRACAAVGALGSKACALACKLLPLLVEDSESLRTLAVKTLGIILSDDADEEVEFEVDLIKSTGLTLGLGVDVADGRTLKIEAVLDGPVSDYNRSVEPDKRIQNGDSIIDVNGVHEDATELLDTLKKSTQLRCRIRRKISDRKSSKSRASVESRVAYANRLGLILSNDPCKDCRIEAAAGLAELGAAGTREVLALVRALMDPDDGVKEACRRSLNLMAHDPTASDIVLHYIGRTNPCSLMRMLCFRALSCLKVLPMRISCAIICEWFSTPHAAHAQSRFLENVEVVQTRFNLLDDSRTELHFPWSVIRATDATDGSHITYVVFHGCDVRYPAEAFEFCELISGVHLRPLMKKETDDRRTIGQEADVKDSVCMLEEFHDVLVDELVQLHAYLLNLVDADTKERRNRLRKKYVSMGRERDFNPAVVIGSLGILCLTGHGKGGIAATMFSMLLSNGIFSEQIHRRFDSLVFTELDVITFGAPRFIYSSDEHSLEDCKKAYNLGFIRSSAAGFKKAYVLDSDPVPALFGADSENLRAFYTKANLSVERSKGLALLNKIASSEKDRETLIGFADILSCHQLHHPWSLTHKQENVDKHQLNEWYSLDMSSMSQYTDATFYEYAEEIQRSGVNQLNENVSGAVTAVASIHSSSPFEANPTAFLSRIVDQWHKSVARGDFIETRAERITL